MFRLEDFIGQAKCGCVYHAEEGVACPHDEQLYLAAISHDFGPRGKNVVDVNDSKVKLMLDDDSSSLPTR